MKLRPAVITFASLTAVTVALAVGCAHPLQLAVPDPRGSSTPGGPNPSPGASGSPVPCGSPDPNVFEFIAMTSTATATNDPNYGVINGYTDQYIDGVPAQVANVITVPSSTVTQFANLEPLPFQPPEIVHSAAALPTAFPSPSYTFPPNEEVPLGTVISNLPWSTGPVGQDLINFNICYSQTFTLPARPGVYAFGDLTYFGLSNMRDVVVVSADASVRHPSSRRLRRAKPKPEAN